MARCGRKPLAEAAVEQLDGSSHAKQRLKVILKSLRGELTIPEACRLLGIGESRFHVMRKQWLQESLQLLEPRPVGRPAKRDSTVDRSEVEDLEAQVQRLKHDLAVSDVRQQISVVMPHLIKPARLEKKVRRGRSRRAK